MFLVAINNVRYEQIREKDTPVTENSPKGQFCQRQKKRSLLSVKRQFCLSKDTSVKKIDRTGKILHKNRKKGHYNEHLDFRNHPIQNIK